MLAAPPARPALQALHGQACVQRVQIPPHVRVPLPLAGIQTQKSGCPRLIAMRDHLSACRWDPNKGPCQCVPPPSREFTCDLCPGDRPPYPFQSPRPLAPIARPEVAQAPARHRNQPISICTSCRGPHSSAVTEITRRAARKSSRHMRRPSSRTMYWRPHGPWNRPLVQELPRPAGLAARLENVAEPPCVECQRPGTGARGRGATSCVPLCTRACSSPPPQRNQP